MSSVREKFATQVNSEILAEVRVLARTEGRQLQTLVDEALSDLIEKRRGARPRSHVRDPGLLEAALFRPQTGYYEDLIEEAAALWESLAQNHPFIDGNKRVAFAAAFTFLAINDAKVTAEADATYAFIAERYATQTFDFENLSAWLRENVRIARRNR